MHLTLMEKKNVNQGIIMKFSRARKAGKRFFSPLLQLPFYLKFSDLHNWNNPGRDTCRPIKD